MVGTPERVDHDELISNLAERKNQIGATDVTGETDALNADIQRLKQEAEAKVKATASEEQQQQ